MGTTYPQILGKGSRLIINLLPNQVQERISNLDFVLDVDKKTGNIVGIEIINLKQQSSCGNLQMNDQKVFVDGLTWDISYKDEYDVAYIDFKKNGDPINVKTKQAKGTIYLDTRKNIVGLEIDM
ncbi:MAG: hypothetical protein WC897_04110 [Candidatus Gracilibacteria bacterium]